MRRYPRRFLYQHPFFSPLPFCSWILWTTVSVFVILNCGLTHAQVVLDGTTGGVAGQALGAGLLPNGQTLSDGSTVTEHLIPHDVGTLIDQNLFHSFQDFSIASGTSATFTGPNTINNVLSRVTGTQSSNIQGKIASTIENANLFLLNPNGVIFGPNATLDLRGSFHVSTADALGIQKNGTVLNFYADVSLDGTSGSVLHVPSLETFGFVGNPTTFGFTTENPKAIEIDRSVLEVGSGQTVSIVAGQPLVGQAATGSTPDIGISMKGGSLIAPEGKVNVVSVASEGKVTLINDDVKLVAKGGHIAFAQESLVDVSGDPGGSVVIRGGEFQIDDSGLFAGTSGTANGAPVGIDIQVEDNLVIANGSALTTDVLGTGNAGDIRLQGDHIHMSGESLLGSREFPGSGGNGGDLRLEGNSVMIEKALLQNATFGTGAAGDIQIITQQSLQMKRTSVDTRSLDLLSGNSGSVFLQTGQNASFSTTTIQTDSMSLFGQAGLVNINAGQDLSYELGSISTISSPNLGLPSGDVNIAVKGNAIIDLSDIQTQSISTLGRGGDVAIHADTLRLNLSNITTESFSQRAGHVEIEVGEYVQENASNINTRTRSTGMAGDIFINAQRTAEIRGRENGSPSILDTSSFEGAPGNSGTIRVISPDIIFDNTRMISNTTGPGQAGSLTIQGTRVTSTNGTILANGTTDGSTGSGGMLAIHARESIIFTGSSILNDTSGGGNAGGIRLRSPSIQLGDETLLVSGTTGTGNGGNITIETDRLTMTDGSGLSNLVDGAGQGGSIDIVAQKEVVLSGATTAIFAGTFGDGDSGDITVTSPMVLLDGGQIAAPSSDVRLPDAEGNAGNLHFEVGKFTMRAGAIVGAPPAGSTNAGTGGDITIHATESVTLEEASSIVNGTNATVGAGTVTIQSPILTLSGDSLIETQTTSSGPSGDIILNVGKLNLVEGGALSSSTDGSGPAGQVLIEASDTVLIQGRDPFEKSRSAIASASDSGGSAGNIQINTPNLVLLDGGLITVKGFESGNAGNIVIRSETIQSQNGEITTQAATGAGGRVDLQATRSISLVSSEVSGAVTGGGDATRTPADVRLSAGRDLTLTQGTTVSARSDGAVDAGNVVLGGVDSSSTIKQENGQTIPLAHTIRLENSTVSTNSGSETGGNISLNADFLIDVIDSTIQSDIGQITEDEDSGGNIDLDPRFIVLQGNSLISARSEGGGAGGTVSLGRADTNIITDSGRETSDFVDVSSVGGQAGQIIIRGAIQSLSQEATPLTLSFPNVAHLFASRCAAQQEGQFSSIVQRPPDGLPPAPGDFFPSPLTLDGSGGFLAQDHRGASPPRFSGLGSGFTVEPYKSEFPSDHRLFLTNHQEDCQKT